ncbi:MAG: hypothetical protein WBP95_15180 [Acidobacteriaceae bacterium]
MRTTAMAPAATKPGRARIQGKAMGVGAEASRTMAVMTDSAKPEDGSTLSLPWLRARSKSASVSCGCGFMVLGPPSDAAR